MSQNKTKRIFISACEPSADVHCAALIKAVAAKTGPNIEWVGVGGQKMAEAGCELLAETSKRAVMIYNAFSKIGYYYKILKEVRNYLKRNRVDLVVVCDSPAFNFHVAKAGKKSGAKVLFYVAPQLWAWAAWRIWKLRRRCDKLACILPFEEQWFAGRGVDATFVGNPLFDDITVEADKDCKTYTGYDPAKANILLLPGSRQVEIKLLWPAMQKIAERISQRWSGAKFTVAAVDKQKLKMLKENKVGPVEYEYTISAVTEAAGGADFALVTSGSATLQVASAGCPMVIMYQSSRILWHLVGRWLTRTRYLSLVNILARRELVSEFMPYFSSTEPIFGKCIRLLSSPNRLMKVSRELVELVEPLARDNASENVAEMAVEMMGISQKLEPSRGS
ncbi:MAG: lipid-A-disaccharide synthase [Planctomycetota bacterium]|nr:MAG: lipid-A-disaccharide synthase [Planctomycetota bacterium]